MGRPPPKIACSQTRLINLVGGGQGERSPEKGEGSVREAGKEKAGSGIPRGELGGGRNRKQLHIHNIG